MNRIFTFLIAVLTFGLCFAPEFAHASLYGGYNSTGLTGTEFLSSGATLVQTVYNFGTNIIYFIGGLGIILMAGFAFLGRFKWPHFFAICGGIFVVAGSNYLIQFLSGSTANMLSSTGASLF